MLSPFRSTPSWCVPSRISAKSFSRFSDFVLLLCIICQFFALRLFGLPISRCSWDNLRSVSEGSGMRLVQVLLHFFQKCTGLFLLISFFSELLQGLPEPACVTVFNFGDMVCLSVSLSELSLQLLAKMFFFSFTSVPSSSTWWGMSLHFAGDFELFHLSFRWRSAASWILSSSPLMATWRAFGSGRA